MMSFPPEHFAGKRVTVMGLGHFGGQISAIKFLVAQGANVTVTDIAPADKLQLAIKQIEHLSLTLHLGGHIETDFTDTDLVVVSPAVPKRSRYLKLAGQEQVPLTCEMNLFLDRCRAKVIGLTGTVGKSTTLTMLGTILKASHGGELKSLGYNNFWIGGNIGKSLLEDVVRIQADDLVVLELSSFQLEDLSGIEYSPEIAVVTNISPNHLDRHPDFQSYIEAKGNITRYQSSGDLLVLNSDDANCEALKEIASGEVGVRWFGRQENAGGKDLCVSLARQEGLWELCYDSATQRECIITMDQLPVPGQHNLQNAAAAAATAFALGLSAASIRAGLLEFKGLPDRLEFVAQIDNVCWYNDSKSTAPESGIVAVEAFPDKSVITIVGGYDKELDLSSFAKVLAGRAKISICLGQTGPILADVIRQYGGEVIEVDSLEEAVQRAAHLAVHGNTVLLSPGCASWDMFDNYYQRGQRFRELVAERAKAVSIH